MIKRSIIFLSVLFFALNSKAQITWHNPLKSEYPVIQNRGWSDEIKESYQRLPDRAQEKVRKAVWGLSQNSAGLAIHFYTNASEIQIRYGVKSGFAMSHMPATGKSGVDLYAIDQDGDWRYLFGKYNFADTVSYTYKEIIGADTDYGYEYRLFLPLYNTVSWLEIGVQSSASFSFIPELKEKPIVVYGTSIAQGGCASRSAMGWTNILSRKTNLPVINLGFSGNGPLESEVVDLLAELDASIIIYDCLPNMRGLTTDEVIKRTIYGIETIREKSNVPILITDHIGYSNYKMNQKNNDDVIRLNNASYSAFDSLQRAEVENVFYLDKEKLNFPDDGTVDYVHPNDLGMQAYADAYEIKVRKILNMPKE